MTPEWAAAFAIMYALGAFSSVGNLASGAEDTRSIGLVKLFMWSSLWPIVTIVVIIWFAFELAYDAFLKVGAE